MTMLGARTVSSNGGGEKQRPSSTQGCMKKGLRKTYAPVNAGKGKRKKVEKTPTIIM